MAGVGWSKASWAQAERGCEGQDSNCPGRAGEWGHLVGSPGEGAKGPGA